MKITSFLKFTLATLALVLCFATKSSAQILYLQQVAQAPAHIPPGQFQLRQVNGDGSGDTAIGLPFADVRAPAWSRDAAIFAISAPDPNRPNDRSYNVYAINPATGAIQQITFFQAPPADTNSQFVIAGSKAFSPDRNAMALTSTIVSQGQGQTQQTTVRLEVYSTATVNPLLVHVHSATNGYTVHGGEGVDWAPAQNVLVTPLESSARNQSGGSGSQQTTALFFLEPVDGAVNKGRYRQITFPRGDIASDFSFAWGEHDYQPRFSPNGAAIAYVRSFQNRRFTLSGPDPDVQSIRILDHQTGAETEVLRPLPQGLYVSGLDWSPDGTALVFDVGQQARDLNGTLYQGVAGETAEIYIINVNGTGLRRLRGASSLVPAWRPAGAQQQPAVLGNIATRMRVGSGDNAMIGGFIINGESKKVIIRGMGPSLGAAGVPGALTNPILELFQGNSSIATNDNWQQAPNTNEIPNGFAPGDARESVIVTTLSPGTYTAVVRGVGGETGVGVVETYDLSQSSNSKLANFSTRGFVETGDNAMIGGFIATGGSSRVLLRAMGPSLQNAGIGNALQDPTLQLIDGNGATVTSNDNWQQAPNTNEIPNGFAPGDARESVIVTTLTPGNYTAIVRGSGNTTGVALVEAYHLQ